MRHVTNLHLAGNECLQALLLVRQLAALRFERQHSAVCICDLAPAPLQCLRIRKRCAMKLQECIVRGQNAFRQHAGCILITSWAGRLTGPCCPRQRSWPVPCAPASGERHRPQAVLCLRMCPRAEEAADHSDLDVSRVCRVMLRRRTHDAQRCQQCPSAAISDMSYA